MAEAQQKSAIATAEFVELTMLRLAALAIDLRGQLTPQDAAKAPSIIKILDACDVLLEELGWGQPSVPFTDPNRADCSL